MKINAPNLSSSYLFMSSDSFIYRGSNGLTLGVENTSNVVMQARDSDKTMLKCVPGDSVEIYFNGNKKLETSNTGVTVTGVMEGLSAEAYYADLAEKYTIKEYDCKIGQVVLISLDDNYDGEISNELGSNRILGVLSESPAFKMNNALEDGRYVALKGRIKCLVVGPVSKGEPLISNYDGTAISYKNLEDKSDTFGCLLGRANENLPTSETKLIEVII